MPKSKRRKRRVRIKGILRLLVIIGVVVFAIYMLVKGNFSKEDLTYLLEYDEIHVEDTYKAIIVRKEHILKSSTSGTIVQVADDGERVKTYQRILDITKSDAIEADGLVVSVTNDAEITKYNIEQIDGEIENLKLEIASLIQSKSYDTIKTLASELEAKIERRRMMEEGVSEETYNETQVGSGELEIGESQPIETPLSGILTYYVDGYENQLTYADVMQIDLEEVLTLDIQPYLATQGIVQSGDPICKIIDDDYYYMIILVEPGDQNLYDISEDMVLEIGTERVNGYIAEIIPTSNKVAIAIKVETYVKNFYKDRFADVKITQETHNGLVVKLSSIVTIDDQVGVLVVDRYKEVSFKPIKIVVAQDDSVIVKEGAYYEIIDGKNTRIDTVGVSDRVILNGQNYQPGDKID